MSHTVIEMQAMTALIDLSRSMREIADLVKDKVVSENNGDHQLLLDIQEIMSGVEWNADTLDRIAAHMNAGGYKIEGTDP